MPEHVVTLRLGNTLYAGWQRVAISRGIEQLCGAFDITLTDRWATDGSALQIVDGVACQVLIDGVPVITGYTDEVSPEYGPDAHNVTISGRDATCDLVDCAALHATQEINGRTLLQVTQALCAPFGIPVVAEVDTGGVLPTAHVQPGETVYELLDRLARIRGVLYVADGRGGLVLTRAGTQRARTALERGVNIKSGNARRSQRDRFSEYRVVGQHRPASSSGGLVGFGFDDTAAAQAEATVTDPGITRYRPTVIDAEDQASNADCRTRGQWERSVRAGRGNQATVTVRGWTEAGVLWTPNRLVHARDRWLGLDGTYLIAAVDYNETVEDGQTCDLTLMPPAAFQALPAIAANPTGDAGLFAAGASGGLVGL